MKHHYRFLALLLFFLLISNHAAGQLFSGFRNKKAPDTEELTNQNILFLKETSYGLQAHSRGWGLAYNHGRNKTAFLKQYFAFEFVTMGHDKEARMIPFNKYAKSFIYGKVNHLYLLRGGLGRKKLINSKPYWGGVELRYFYFAGASIGITKPVYLYIDYRNGSPEDDFKGVVAERYDPEKHYLDLIYGRAPYLEGFGEIKLHPGLHAKAGFSFDYGTLNQRIKQVEAGVSLDYLPGDVQIMAYNREHFFVTLHLKLLFGKRYN